MVKFNFKAANVKSGSRSTSESEPYLKVLSSINSFKLNKTALAALGISEGDRVVLFDTFGQSELESKDERFFICKADYSVDGVDQGAVVSKNLLSFSYSSVYSSMLVNKLNVGGMTNAELVEAGYAIERETESGNIAYSAVKSMTYKLIPFMDGEEVEIADGVTRPLFQLVFVREELRRELLSDDNE